MVHHVQPILLPFLGDCSYLSMVCLSVSSPLSVGLKKNCSSSATSEEVVVTSIGVVFTSFRDLRRIFSVTFNASLEKNSAAVLTGPAIYAFWI